MRTTIDLPDDIHQLAREIAHRDRRSMGDVIADLIRLGLRREETDPERSVRGLPQVRVGRTITLDDVRSLDDDT